jgi:hypothetical protein
MTKTAMTGRDAALSLTGGATADRSSADLQQFVFANAVEGVPVHPRRPGRYGEWSATVREHADQEQRTA